MIGNKQGKVWGHTVKLFEQNNVEIHLLTLKKGTYCSLHKHAHKFNLFYCLSGQIKISAAKQANDQFADPDITVIGPDEYTVVKPGLLHQFEVLKKGKMLEVYWVTLEKEDIIRLSKGGKAGT